MTFPFSLIDLTHALVPEMPSWNGSCGFSHEIKLDYKDCSTDVKFRVQQIKMHAGIGTHIDAPSHCIPGGKNVEELDLSQLCASCVVLDISHKANEHYSLSVQDIQDFEHRHGSIAPHTFVIVFTGWERFWNLPKLYHNNHKFPSVSQEAAAFLLDRHIAGLGIDTLSPDRPSDGFPVHQLILGAGKYIVENIANAQKLPPKGAYSLALPLKITHGTEAPLRLVGLLPT